MNINKITKNLITKILERKIIALVLVATLFPVASGVCVYIVMKKRLEKEKAEYRYEIASLEYKLSNLQKLYSQTPTDSIQEQNNNQTENGTERPQVKKATTVSSWTKPQKLKDLGLYKKDPNITEKITNSYYKIANLADGGELILGIYMPGQMGSTLDRFRKTPQAKYYLVSEHSDIYGDNSSWNEILADKVGIDYVDKFQGLITPDSIIDYSNNSFKLGYSKKLFSELPNPIKISESAYGTLYKILKSDSKVPSMKSRNFYLKLSDSTVMGYNLNLPYYNNSSNLVSFTYNNGVKNKAGFLRFILYVCGADDSNVLSTESQIMTNYKIIGATSTGEKVYSVSSLTSSLAKDVYGIYKQVESSLGDMGHANLKGQTIQQFFSKTPVIIIKDKFNDYAVMLDTNYEGPGGCGKPVIYLYPTEKTKVSVKIGADVTISIPKYLNGWNVVADPSGKITYLNKTWPYLYWEGRGFGPYPIINVGFIVPRSSLKTTITDHLIKLGLSGKEKEDFLEFWLPKLPKSPYVRLTWLMTEDMNRIAPLSVTPKPDTVIRIFLDYQGVQKPSPIKNQILRSVPRKGFTLVEWGGLRTW